MTTLHTALGYYFCRACVGAASLLLSMASVKADSVTPATLLEGPTAGTDSVVLVKGNPSATWTSTANAPWLHVAATGDYATNHLQPFTFDANLGITRTGTLTVDGTLITVTQLGSTYTPTTAAPTLLTRADFTRAMAVDQAGNLFFSDGTIIEKWTAATNTVSTIVSSGIVLTMGMTVDAAGNLYIADTNANKVLKWTAATSTLSALVTTGLANPYSVALDPSGNLYIADYYTIWKRPAAGGQLTQAFFTGKTAGMAFDAKGSLYIATNDDQFGTPKMIKKGTPGNSNPPTVNLGQVISPHGVAIDPWGNLLIVDSGDGTPGGPAALRQWNAATAPTTNTVILSDVVYPFRVAVDTQGTVFMADYIDSSNFPVRAKPRAFVDAHGAIMPLAGGSGSLPAVQPATTYLTGPFAPTADQPWITIGAISNGVINFTAASTGATRYSYITVLGQKMLVQQGTPTAPSVTSPTSASVTVITATLGGNVTVEGGSPVTARGVVFARTVDNTNPQIGGSGVTTLSDTATGLGVFTVNATGLLSNTGYTYRAFVTTAYGGTVYTSTATFTTQTATLPTLASPTVSNLGNVSVILNGNITDGGNTAVTARGLVYSLTSDNNNPQIGGANVTVINDAAGGPGTFSAALSGLAYSTGYSFKAFATNIAGTVYSSVTQFTTLDPTYTLGSTSIIDGADAGADSVVLGVTPPSAPWSASSNASWLHLNAGSVSGTGSALILFTFDANTGSTRSGTLTIGGQTLTVTQAPLGYAAVNRATQLGTAFGAMTGGVAVDASGNVFADPTDGTLMRWSPATNAWTQVGTSPVDNQSQLAADTAGNVFISTGYTSNPFYFRRLDKWTAPSGPVSVVYPNAGTPGIIGFYSSKVATDSQHNVWLIDGSITRYNPATNVKTSMFNVPADNAAICLALDAADNVYVGLRSFYGFNFSVMKWTALTGATSIVVPDIGAYPHAITVDGSGNVYVSLADSGTIVKWTAATNTLSTVLTGLTLPPEGSGVRVGQITVDRSGSLYVADNNTIVEMPRVFVPNSQITVGTATGNATLPVAIPSTALALAPFTPSAADSWLHIDSNTAGSVGYSWDASATARYSYLNIAGQRILVLQGSAAAPSVGSPTVVSGNTDATLGGTVISDNGAPITARGIVLALASDNTNPQIGGTGVVLVSDGSASTGTFTKGVTGLSPNRLYAFAAFATNNTGTSYTTVSTFTTAAYDSSVTLPAYDVVFATAPQLNGKLLVGGRSVVMRLDPTNNPDAFYYLNSSSEFVNCLLSLADNSFIMAGSFTNVSGTPRTNIARYDGSGALDSFAPNVNGIISCMALQSDGSILIGGEFTQVNGIARNRIARLYSNGTLDLTFNPNANGPVRSIAIQLDGKLIIGGGFTLVGTSLCNRIARLSSAGVVDATFVTSADASVDVIVLQPDSNIIIGGAFSTLNNIVRPHLARLNPNGTLDNAFTVVTNGNVRTIALQTDGQVFVGGSFTTVAGQPRIGLARLRADGTLGAYNANVTDNSDAPSSVNTVMVAADGRVIIGGEFNKISGSNANFLAGLLNAPVVQTLAPGGSKTVEWERSTSLPEVQDVTFELSTDGGGTWTPLGSATRIAGGWTLSTAATLPSTGQLRARARVVTGMASGSGGWISVESPYTLAAQEIGVEQPENTARATGDTIDLGTLGLNVPVLTTFTVRNSGGYDLTGINVTMSGTNAAMFTVTTKPATSLGSLDSTEFIVQAKLTSSGPKSATINIASNDANENPFVINLTATGATAVVPVVATIAPPTAISYDTATVTGSVDAKGSLREVFFDYGLTTTYSDTVPATTPTTTTSGTFNANLTDLLPHKLYHYRIRAAGDLGNASGADKTFTTLNHAPVANADSVTLLPGAVATIDVLANDTDADDDNLTITAKTAVAPVTAGTVAIVANELVFTAAAGFSGIATFGYTLSDGFGGTSTATVTATAGGVPTFSPTSINALSAAEVDAVTITTSGVWAVTATPTWASVSQTKGTGTSTFNVTVQANATASARNGDLKIGGVLYHITQAAVAVPSIGPLTGTFNTIVGESYSLAIPTTGAPVTYTVIGALPAGLALNQATGIISGVPTAKGDYPLTVKAKNLAGSAPQTLTFTIHVDPLPAGVVGMFHGYVARSASAKFTADPNLGARFEMTTMSNGTASGSVTEGVTKKSFTGGKIISHYATPNAPTFTVALTGTTLFLDITFDASTNTATGVLRNASGLSTAAITAWRNPTQTTPTIVKATSYKAQHNFKIENTDTANGPQGYGYGSFIVTEASGALVISGKLPDGSALTGSTFVGANGEVLIYQALHANHGSCFGKLVIDATHVNKPLDNTLTGNLTWVKPASLPAAKDYIYGAGFGITTPLALDVKGGTFNAPLKGGRLLGALDQADNAQLVFGTAGTDLGFAQVLRIVNPNTVTGTTNTATIPAYNATAMPNPNPNTVAMPTITFGTGVIAGSFKLAGPRTASFNGEVVTIGSTTQGWGFYLLPTTTVATSPKLSGRVELQTH